MQAPTGTCCYHILAYIRAIDIGTWWAKVRPSFHWLDNMMSDLRMFHPIGALSLIMVEMVASPIGGCMIW